MEGLSAEDIATLTSGKWKLSGKYGRKIIIGGKEKHIPVSYKFETNEKEIDEILGYILPPGYDVKKYDAKTKATMVNNYLHKLMKEDE
jgi:hypothetical protein